MAITTGAGPHFAWLTVGGGTFPIEHGSVSQVARREPSGFEGVIPMSFPGAATALADAGGTAASVSVLTRGVNATLITGELDDVNFDFIGRSIQFAGRDKSAALHDNKSSEKWMNKKPSEIVQDLIGRVGLSGNVMASTLMAGKQLDQDYVKLSDNTAFAYIIHKLAQFDGARWWVDANGQFNYVPIGSPMGNYSIFINQSEPITSDCLDLCVRRNFQAGKTIAATVKAWHPKMKQVFSYTSNVEGKGGTLNYNYHIPNLQQDHVTKHAKSQATEKAMHELTVTATVVGDPTVSAGMGLQLSGTGFFDQTYDIDLVQHDFGMSGHRTRITARAASNGRQAS